MRLLFKRTQWGIVIAVIFVLAVCAAYAQTSRELPSLVFDNFSPEIRASIQTAYAEAKAKPHDAEAIGRVAMTLHTHEQHEAAAVWYERARQLAPQEFRWLYYRGIVHALLGKHVDAVATFKAALQLQPDHPFTQLRLADSLLALGNLIESQPLYEALRRKDAKVAQVHYGLGRIAVVQKNTAAAIASFQQALQLFPRYGAAHYALGLALRDAGQASEANEHLKLSQEFKYVRPALEDPLLIALAELNASATIHLKRGVELGEEGKLAEAIAEHERALAVNPRLTQAQINLIQLYGRAGQPEKAEQQYRTLIAVNPNLAESHYNYGVLLTGLGRLDESKQAFQRSLTLNPHHAESHHNYGILIEREGKLDEAAAHYRQALANKPDFRMAHFHLGRILVNQDKFAAAIEQFQLTLLPDDEDTPRFLYALGATYARAGEKQKAMEHLRVALEKARARGQSQLVSALERDLRSLVEQ
ncbi:MAG TPA: tetratricopeptide repeat protein [Blastocatellia bacterium]|nr:tetratricopeptide repeat protein [Blastocatellia bacterium]